MCIKCWEAFVLIVVYLDNFLMSRDSDPSKDFVETHVKRAFHVFKD